MCASVVALFPVRNSDSRVARRIFSEVLPETIVICTFVDIYLRERSSIT